MKTKKPEVRRKRAVILRGIPGSGKSLYAAFVFKPQDAKIISSDDLFYSMKENKHIYQPSLEHQSHQYCQTSFLLACQAGERLVVVDDFNIFAEDLAFYEKIAEYYGFPVEIIRFPWKEPPNNWRKLSRSLCESMQGELNKQPPKANERSL